MFDTGDIVKTDEATSRTGTVRTQLASGQYQVCFDAEETDCAFFDDAQLTLVKEEGAVVLPTTTTIVPEDERVQQAKQRASLSREELAQLEEEHQAALGKQAEAEARANALSLETVDAQVLALEARVSALEKASGISVPAEVPSAASESEPAPPASENA